MAFASAIAAGAKLASSGATLLKGASIGARIGFTAAKIAPVVVAGSKISAGILTARALTQALKPQPFPELPALPQAPTFEQAQVKGQEDKREILRRKRTGTILTSPQGDLLSPVNVSGKTLLGG